MASVIKRTLSNQSEKRQCEKKQKYSASVIDLLGPNVQLVDDYISSNLDTLVDENSIDRLCLKLKSVDLTPKENEDLLGLALRVNNILESNSDATRQLDINANTNSSTTDSKLDISKLQTDAFTKDEDGDTFLHVAIILKSIEWSAIFIALAKNQIELSLFNRDLQTPLHLAVITRLENIVRQLVCGGSDVTAVDKNGNTPLHIACRDGLTMIVEHLVTPVKYKEVKGLSYTPLYQPVPQDFDIANYDGLTCLHLAVMNNHENVLGILLDKDINLNIVERKEGKTALHIAAAKGNIKMINILAKNKKGNINAQMYNGKSPLDLAYDCRQIVASIVLGSIGGKRFVECTDDEL
ncbi:hypothetical protein DPMN_112109 [Dreissena polymorpha]|uniref:Uncharacterized protein n=1 Tax=Dreissena polymorpha TaxID=45954 RepID=A0A9D4QPF8_DREPO|nr:hypothetical protein DPMN_112109 [Dreissena polymorpha]